MLITFCVRSSMPLKCVHAIWNHFIEMASYKWAPRMRNLLSWKWHTTLNWMISKWSLINVHANKRSMCVCVLSLHIATEQSDSNMSFIYHHCVAIHEAILLMIATKLVELIKKKEKKKDSNCQNYSFQSHTATQAV